MTTRNRVVTVAAVGLVAFGIWLGNLFQGFGLGGSGSGTEVGIPGGSSSPPASNVDLVGDPDPVVRATGSRSREFLTIVIQGSQYRLADDDDPTGGETASLATIRQQAAHVPGDDQRVRVRIYLSKTAQEGARSDLYAALLEAGVKREEIQEIPEFID